MPPATSAVRASIRVGGVTYRSPAEAFAGAETIESDAQERADAYRANGDEGIADRTIDAGRAKAESLRAWGREREEYEASAATQPAGRPQKPAGRRQGAAKRTGRARGGSGSRFGGSSAAIARRGFARSGAQATVRSYGNLGWELVALTIGLALLTLFLTPRGTKAFAELANFAAGALRLIVDPIDPLAAGQLDKIFGASQPAVAAPPGALGPTRPPTNRRSSRRVAQGTAV